MKDCATSELEALIGAEPDDEGVLPGYFGGREPTRTRSAFAANHGRLQHARRTEYGEVWISFFTT